MCQIADSGDRWYGLGKGDQLLSLGLNQRDDTKAHSSETCVDVEVEKEVQDAFSKVGFPCQKVKNSHEVTSPNKPKKEYQAGVTAVDHNSAHEVSKIQKRNGRLKRVAREKGQAQTQGAENKSQILGVKRLGSVIFTENEENITHKKQCGGFSESLNELKISAVAARQHRREP